MEKNLCCGGCIQFADREGLLIDDRDHDTLMAAAIAIRHKKHKHRDKQCLMLWSRPKELLTTKEHVRMHKLQREFIRERGFNPDRLQLFDAQRLSTQSSITDYFPRSPPSVNHSQDISNEDIDIDNGVCAEAPSTPNDDSHLPPSDNGTPVALNDVITSPSKNKIRNVNLHTQSFYSQKQHFCFDIPVSHRIVHGKYLTELEKDREALHQLRDGTWLQRFAKSANSKLKTYLAVALAAAPALAVTAAGYFIPMVVTAFLHHYGLFGKVGKLENYAKSFPSETYLRERIIETAAENLVWLAYELDDKKVFMSCDKGEY